jgi:hypothetical protein
VDICDKLDVSITLRSVKLSLPAEGEISWRILRGSRENQGGTAKGQGKNFKWEEEDPLSFRICPDDKFRIEIIEDNKVIAAHWEGKIGELVNHGQPVKLKGYGAGKIVLLAK